MIGNLDIQKQQCLQTVVRGVLFKRCLETVRTVEEFKDFCARKRIDVPGFTENYRRQFNSLNQYGKFYSLSFFLINNFLLPICFSCSRGFSTKIHREIF